MRLVKFLDVYTLGVSLQETSEVSLLENRVYDTEEEYILCLKQMSTQDLSHLKHNFESYKAYLDFEIKKALNN